LRRSFKLDVEAFGGLDILEVDAAEGRFERGDDVDQLVDIGFVDLDVEESMAANFLKSTPLPSITGLAASAPRSPEAEDGGAVGDDADQVGARGVIGGRRRIGDDLLAGEGDARRIGHRQIVLVGQDLGRADGNLTGGRPAMIFEGGLAQVS
jgi:hypothetical protein